MKKVAAYSLALFCLSVGIATQAHATPSYWHYCPGNWHYTVPPPAWADLSQCQWFAVTVTKGPNGPVYDFRPADPSEVPPPSPGFPWP